MYIFPVYILQTLLKNALKYSKIDLALNNLGGNVFLCVPVHETDTHFFYVIHNAGTLWKRKTTFGVKDFIKQ